MSADTTCSSGGSKQDDCIAKELDVVLEDGLLLRSELGLGGVEHQPRNRSSSQS